MGSATRGGHWKPFKRVEYPAVFVWPVRPLGTLKWLFGYPSYILPWHLFHAAIAVAVWMYPAPPIEISPTFTPGWIGFVFARNLCLVVLFFGAFHLRLYIRKAQGDMFKYSPKWQDTDNPTFLFGDQNDNMIWTLASGVSIWSAYEVLTLWVFANGYLPWVSWEAHPVYRAF